MPRVSATWKSACLVFTGLVIVAASVYLSSQRPLPAPAPAPVITDIAGEPLADPRGTAVLIPAEQMKFGLDLEQLPQARAAALDAHPQALGAYFTEADNESKNARLWEPMIVGGAGHLPNFAQQIGDCVSFGESNAIAYSLAFRRRLNGSTEWVRPFPPYLYGTCRVTHGRNQPPCRSDGAFPDYMAAAYEKHGWVTFEESGYAYPAGYRGAIASDYGCKGPPAALLDKGKARAGGTQYPVRSAAEARDAICNGYALTIGSDFGTRTIRPQDGRQVARWDATWPHQMAIVAYDGSASKPYFYFLNSWGPNAHPAPLQDEPPGGFWVDSATLDRIIQRGGLCYAISVVKGFDDADIDWSIFDRLLRGEPQPIPKRPDFAPPAVILNPFKVAI